MKTQALRIEIIGPILSICFSVCTPQTTFATNASRHTLEIAAHLKPIWKAAAHANNATISAIREGMIAAGKPPPPLHVLSRKVEENIFSEELFVRHSNHDLRSMLDMASPEHVELLWTHLRNANHVGFATIHSEAEPRSQHDPILSLEYAAFGFDDGHLGARLDPSGLTVGDPTYVNDVWTPAINGHQHKALGERQLHVFSGKMTGTQIFYNAYIGGERGAQWVESITAEPNETPTSTIKPDKRGTVLDDEFPLTFYVTTKSAEDS